jgi:GR25 family glycosyltransferase involved in LPS biosynthesis
MRSKYLTIMPLPSTWSELTSDKAVVMGLKRYSFRREYSAARLAAAGFSNIECVDSFDGFNENIDEALKNLGVVFNSSLGKGHKGCSYSHMAQWKDMIDNNIPYRILFEDDALGHLDLPKGLGQKFWDATPKDFDILYLGNMMNPHDPELSDPNKLVVQIPTYCLHAYLITLEGAKRLFQLAKEMNAGNEPLNMLDIQLVFWQQQGKIKWYCWNGTWTQKSFPTFDEGLPWQAFQDVITPQKDTGLFWQNMRVGTTLEHPTLQLTIPQYSR